MGLKIEAEFVTSAAGADDFPGDRLPEIALVGRSNVGKSSLINALVRKPLARTSAAPGKTRLANFYRVQRGSGPTLYLVDLPGYGYARGGDAAAAEFNRLAEAYFSRACGASHWHPTALENARRGPRGEGSPRGPEGSAPHKKEIGVLLLVDSRHPGLEADLDAWAWAQSLQCPSGVIGTKVDKLTRAERSRNARAFESLFNIPVPLVSADTGEGLDELWKMIARLPSRTAA